MLAAALALGACRTTEPFAAMPPGDERLYPVVDVRAELGSLSDDSLVAVIRTASTQLLDQAETAAERIEIALALDYRNGRSVFGVIGDPHRARLYSRAYSAQMLLEERRGMTGPGGRLGTRR